MGKDAKSFASQASLTAIMKQKGGGVLHKGPSQYEFGETYEGGDAWAGSGTSIFDPVLCELSYRWFCPPGGVIVDPFAGGSVRGIVASCLGFRYYGVDLSARQLEANRAQAARICDPDNQPTWVHGNSLDIETLLPGVEADMIFSCPPYAHLEVYSDDPRDLSTMPYDQFRDVYGAIIAAVSRMLLQDRHAVFVVGDVRDKAGNYLCFPEDTVMAFKAAGLAKYNESVLVTSVGSLPVRVGKPKAHRHRLAEQFVAGGKLGKSHQNVLGFIKGDAKVCAKLIAQGAGT